MFVVVLLLVSGAAPQRPVSGMCTPRNGTLPCGRLCHHVAPLPNGRMACLGAASGSSFRAMAAPTALQGAAYCNATLHVGGARPILLVLTVDGGNLTCSAPNNNGVVPAEFTPYAFQVAAVRMSPAQSTASCPPRTMALAMWPNRSTLVCHDAAAAKIPASWDAKIPAPWGRYEVLVPVKCPADDRRRSAAALATDADDVNHLVRDIMWPLARDAMADLFVVPVVPTSDTRAIGDCSTAAAFTMAIAVSAPPGWSNLSDKIAAALLLFTAPDSRWDLAALTVVELSPPASSAPPVTPSSPAGDDAPRPVSPLVIIFTAAVALGLIACVASLARPQPPPPEDPHIPRGSTIDELLALIDTSRVVMGARGMTIMDGVDGWDAPYNEVLSGRFNLNGDGKARDDDTDDGPTGRYRVDRDAPRPSRGGAADSNRMRLSAQLEASSSAVGGGADAEWSEYGGGSDADDDDVMDEEDDVDVMEFLS
jgi:hypothetical protein